MIEKTLSEHIIMVVLFCIFGPKRWFLNKNNFISQNYRSFYRINSNWARKHSLKIWACSDHFRRFHRYWKFKIHRNKSMWCKTYIYKTLYNNIIESHIHDLVWVEDFTSLKQYFIHIANWNKEIQYLISAIEVANPRPLSPKAKILTTPPLQLPCTKANRECILWWNAISGECQAKSRGNVPEKYNNYSIVNN